MNPKPTALFIDDDSLFDRGGVSEYMSLLEEFGYEVQHRPCPDSGKLAIEEKSFDIVFVDYLFHNAPHTQGADLGEYILSRFPMTQVILMSGRLRDEDAMNKYIGVQFHASFDKEHASDLIEEKLKTAMAIAKERFLARAPVFDEKKAERYKLELDALDCACQQNGGSRNARICTESKYIVEAANIIWAKGGPLSEEDFDDLRIHRLEPTEQNKNEKERVQIKWAGLRANSSKGDHGITPSSWIQRFQIWKELGGKKTLVPESIIIRNILMSSPGTWKYACEQFSPLSELVDYFKIGEYSKGSNS